ncbi:MAG: hypothetical protein GYA21_12560 [Myxococcales bacterium]|nr:hypothetical protein [Myxococcales bacterium]
MLESHLYKPYGQEYSQSGFTAFLKYRFNDRRDEGSGLLRWPLRNFKKESYHWTAFDPVARTAPDALVADGSNFFAYCGYDPVNTTDPAGGTRGDDFPWAKIGKIRHWSGGGGSDKSETQKNADDGSKESKRDVANPNCKDGKCTVIANANTWAADDILDGDPSPTERRPPQIARNEGGFDVRSLDPVSDFLESFGNTSAGIGDTILLGTGPLLRKLFGLQHAVNTSSMQYSVGGWVGTAIGLLRITYALSAKTYALLSPDGATASAGRTFLKKLFSLGLNNGWRNPAANKYATDMLLKIGAGYTNPLLNIWGAGMYFYGIMESIGVEE